MMAVQEKPMLTGVQGGFPPGPKRNPVIQMAKFVTGLGYQSEELLDLIMQWFDDFGDTVGVDTLGLRYVFIRHPEDIHDVVLRKAASFTKSPDYTNQNWGLASFLGNGLLVSDGEFWKRQRKLVQPAFHARRIEAYAATMVSYTQQMVAQWTDGQQIQLDQAMSGLTMQIVAKSLFNEDISKVVDQVSQAMETLQDVATHPSPLPDWLPLPRNQRKRQAIQMLDELVYGFIEDWRRERLDRGDLISMLMLGVDEEDQGMSDRQVRDELVTLLLAGHETTANALNWTFFLLAKNPNVADRLFEEVDRVLGKRTAELGDLASLVYTKAVIEESMRLYPPAWSFSRMATEPVEIGGYRLEKGNLIGVTTFAVHRDPRWWDEPEAFRPERFLAPEPERPKYAYLPFGGGARICVGNHFAMMEAQLLLATISQHFRLDLVPGQIIKPKPLITLVPRDGIVANVWARG
jgi:cytochrome P450